MRELLFYLLVKGFGLYQAVISVGIHLVNITQTFLLWIRGGGINAGDVQGSNLVVVHTTVGCEILNAVENLELIKKSYSEVIPGLSLKDINREATNDSLLPRKEMFMRIKIAGILEIFQRNFLYLYFSYCLKMPIIMYRIIHKILI